MEKKLSNIGTFCYLVNSLQSFGLFFVPYVYSLSTPGQAIITAVLILSAAMSYYASKLIISLIALRRRNNVSGLESGLLRTETDPAPEQYDLPQLLTVFEHRDGSLFLFTTGCCLLCVVEIGMISMNAVSYGICRLANSESSLLEAAVTTAFTAVISVFSLFDLVQMEVAQMIATVARLLTLVFSVGFVSMKYERFLQSSNISDYVFVAYLPGFFWLFFYQIPLPSILSASKSDLKTQKELQILALCVTVCCYLILAFVPYAKEEPEQLQHAAIGFVVCFTVSIVSSSCIYWQSFAHMLLRFRYGQNLPKAIDLYPKRIKAVRIFAHFPAFASYLAYKLISETTQSEDFKYNYILLGPFLALLLYFLTCRCSEQLFSNSDTARDVLSAHKLDVNNVEKHGLKWLSLGVCVVGVAATVWMDELRGSSLMRARYFWPFAVDFIVVVALVAWRLIGL